MTDLSVVILGQKGEIRQAKLKSTEPKAMATVLKKKEVPSVLGRYTWKQKTLFLFGYTDGRSDQENQHHLPPPLEGMTFFGDILLLASSSPSSYTNTIIPMKTADYETFYTQKLEGEDEDEDEEDDFGEEALEQVDGDGHVNLEEEDQDDDTEESATDIIEEEEEEEEEEEIEGGDGEDDEIVPVRLKKAPAKPRAPRGTRRTANQSHAQDSLLNAEKDIIEISPQEQAHEQPIRVHMKQILEKLFAHENFPVDEFELLLFQSSLEQATKQKIPKSWQNTLFEDLYKSICRKCIGNLHPNSYVKNTNLWMRYKNGEFTLQQIAKQNYYELFPETWQVMVDKQAKREQIQVEGDFSRATDRWQCNNCKMRKCTFYELQTRSADEPMTIFIHCLNCNKRWTQ